MRFLLFCLLVVGALESRSFAQATGAATPLDVPSGYANGNEEEEDEPETITFYGSDFEGDGFFWCLDKSCSMSGSPLATLKSETTNAVQQLSKYSEFGIISFNSSYSSFMPIPVKGDPANKAAGVSYIQSLSSAGLTCLAPAGVACVNLANQSSKQNKVMIFVGDGEPYCGGGGNYDATCLSSITAANFERTPINTLWISSGGSGQGFFQSLANSNNGTFTSVN